MDAHNYDCAYHEIHKKIRHWLNFKEWHRNKLSSWVLFCERKLCKFNNRTQLPHNPFNKGEKSAFARPAEHFNYCSQAAMAAYLKWAE